MMKKFLRMLSIAMALVMCFTMVFTTAVSAEGTTPAITLGDAKTALAGDTITIPVTLEGFAAAGIVGAEFNVDLGGLEYVSNDAVVDGEAVANYADGVVRYADVPGDVTDGEVAPYEDGTLFTITATIPADAETDATYTVTVSDVVAATSAEEKVEVTGGEVVITVGSAEVPCEHSNLNTFVSATPAVNGGENGSITFICDDCGEEVTKDVVYNSKSSLTSAAAIGCDSTTQLIVRHNYNNNYKDLATQGVMVYTQYYGNGAGETTKSFAASDEFIEDGYFKWRVPVKFTQFTDVFECTFYTLRDGVWTNAATRTYTIRSAAMTVIKGSDPDGVKKAAANLLKVGAEVQKTFNYNVADLADSELIGDYASYVTTEAPSVEKIVGTNYVQNPTGDDRNGKVIFATPAVLLDDAVAFKLKLNPTYFDGGKDALTDITVKYSYTAENGASVEGVLTDYEWNKDNRAEVLFKVTAPNMRSIVNFEVYNGDTKVSETAVYSIEGVLAHYYTQYTDIVNAVLNYSDAVAAYF